MKEQVFADGMTTIGLSNGAVRMVLFNAETDSEGNLVGRKEDRELVMPPQGFIDAFSAMYKLAWLLQRDGLIRLPDLEPFPVPSQSAAISASADIPQKTASAPQEAAPEPDESFSPNFE